MPQPLAEPSVAPVLLEIEDLSVQFPADGQAAPRGTPLASLAKEGQPLVAVDGLSLRVPKGSTRGLVGESGSGKSVTALAILGLLGTSARVTGRVRFAGDDVLAFGPEKLRELRGGRIGMVFQDPGAALDPFHRVGDQIAEAIRAHAPVSAAELDARVIGLLRDVGIPAPEERRHAYPHQLSGGMKQRVMIAIALACDPLLLLADEPTTALDVTVQAQVLELLKKQQAKRGMSILLITHDLGLVADSCDTVSVMYAGKVVEHGPTAQILASPRHPYTAGLLASTPHGDGTERLREIPGVVPDLRTLPPGCRFQDRCTFVKPECGVAEPPLVSLGERAHRCFFPLGGGT